MFTMIVWYWLFVAVLFKCSASSKFTIDWSLCDKEMECFALDQCITATDPKEHNKLSSYHSRNPLIIPDCQLGIQKRSYTSEKVLYIIQVNKGIQQKKIELLHADEVILSCQEENGKIIVKSVDTSYSQVNLKLYEDVSRFDKDLTLCAFTVEKMSLFQKLSTLNSKYSSVRYDQDNHLFFMGGKIFFTTSMHKVSCDPDSIQDTGEKQGLQILPLKYRARMTLDCAHYKSDLGIAYDYHLYIEQGDSDPIKVDKLECVENLYTFKNGTEDVTISDSLYAYCGADLHKFCKNSLNCAEGLCPKFKDGDNTKNPTLECGNGKWMIGENYYEGIQPICDIDAENNAIFRMNYPDGKQEILKEGRCFEKYDCIKISQLDIIDCNTNRTDCGRVVVADEIYCEDREMILTISSRSEMINNTQSFRCNSETGLYTNGSVTIPIDSRITCYNPPEKEKEPWGDAFVAGVSTGAAFASIIGVLAISALVYCVVARRNRYRFLQQEVWKRKAPKDKINDALKTFKEATMAKPDDELTLLDALKLLDAILDNELDDPEVWAAIDTFLKRLQAVAFYKSQSVERAFNRYCYLQAKKIIDKHGWISPLQVTKSNPSGFIRTCAVQLLAFARRDDVDAQSLILDGFKQLRLNAAEQYPHCGLLWSLIAQQRIGNYDLQNEFFERLLAIVHDGQNGEKKEIEDNGTKQKKHNKSVQKDNKIPESDRFPQFGSIKDQCCYALGCSDVADVSEGVEEILLSCGVENEEWESLSQRIFNGILGSTSGNTLYLWFKVYGNTLTVGPNLAGSDAHKILYRRLFPTEVELESIMIPLVFHRRFLDAQEWELNFYQFNEDEDVKRLEDDSHRDEIKRRETEERIRKRGREKDKCIREGTRLPTPIYDKVKEIHSLFVACFNNESDDILSWLTGKIGKDDMKVHSRKESERSTKSITSSNSIQMRMENKNGASNDFYDKFAEGFHKRIETTRVMKCMINEEEQMKYRTILAEILSEETINGMRMYFLASDVIEICRRAIEVCETEPALIEDVPPGITVVGDLHGQTFDLARVFNENAKDGKPGYETTRYLFTGDYMDRGDQCLEVVMALYILKILYPDRFIILRGNHEFIDMNYRYGSMEEMLIRYDIETGDAIYRSLNESFSYLSICAIIGDKIFCAHGGMSGGTLNRHELRLVRKPIGCYTEDVLVSDLVWADPSKSNGFFVNIERGYGIYYGEDVTLNALDRLECTGIIRGHTLLKKGYSKPYPSCLSIFNATATDSRMNDAAFVRITEDLKYEIIVLKYDRERETADLEHYGPKKDDELTTRQMGTGAIR